MKYFVLSYILLITCSQQANAGPPFNTDDPEPVELNHWEYYISTINTFRSDVSAGTSPHIEVNYGLVPNVQVHLILPMNYDYSRQYGFKLGYAYTELGVKYRFVQETEDIPQLGTFPIVEIPTIRNNEFGNGQAELFIPLWAQKSWGKLTTYGGAGYWINPGIHNKNWGFTGWEVQYDFSPLIMMGGELYYHTADVSGDKPVLAFNTGGSLNFSQKFHFIFSAGHSLINNNFTTLYLGLLWTI
ncbi:MAG: hypothetical protein Q8904_11310 [Bacteroidota bacterium]|nr:hypothetical protein [Bacteroidota bacterium]